jgi:predicted metal-binding protein
VPETRADKTRTPEGEGFLPRVEDAGRNAGVAVRGTACLMGCEHGCNLAISAPGKITYVLGRFDGSAEDAEAVAEYAAKHGTSDTGTVPYREWPQGVKGHFIARVPPL